MTYPSKATNILIKIYFNIAIFVFILQPRPYYCRNIETKVDVHFVLRAY
jgi:hypothetical protein